MPYRWKSLTYSGQNIFKLWYVLFEIPSSDLYKLCFQKVPDSFSYCPHQMLAVGYTNSNSYVACGFSVVLNTYVENHHNECCCSMANITYSYPRDRVLQISASKFNLDCIFSWNSSVPQSTCTNIQPISVSGTAASFHALYNSFFSPLICYSTLCSIRYWQRH